ncbi:hypothetical protein ACTVCO_07755 [Sanguibacter sp. A247]|uniref:hypothetical protein n=1 Tax=unclassified Sanguibacter TaxID=2645534 RepID=UPI003FD73B6F
MTSRLSPEPVARRDDERTNPPSNLRVEGTTQTDDYKDAWMNDRRAPTAAEIEAWQRENAFLPLDYAR